MVFHAFMLRYHFLRSEMLMFSGFGENVRQKLMYRLYFSFIVCIIKISKKNVKKYTG